MLGIFTLFRNNNPERKYGRFVSEVWSKIGKNVALSEKINEPDLTTIGMNTLVGEGAVITAHEIILKNGKMVIRFDPIVIGENWSLVENRLYCLE